MAHLPEHFRTKYDVKELSELAGQSLAAIQKRAIEQALIRNNWKCLATARELNIDKGTLRRMMEQMDNWGRIEIIFFNLLFSYCQTFEFLT